MKKKSSFERKYPLFVEYFEDEIVQKNMLSNNDLLRKYNDHNAIIQTFVNELIRHFDRDTIASILKETVLKYPDEILLSFIRAYLNSDEETKNNANIVNFYNKTLHLGEDCIFYIEQKGIIANRKYHDLPELVTDELYNELKTENEFFQGYSLEKLYLSLKLPQKRYVVSLLKNKSFEILDILFCNVESDFNDLINLLITKNIDSTIVNSDLMEFLGEYNLLRLVYSLLDSDDSLINNIQFLIKNNRLRLIKNLIEKEMVFNLGNLNTHELKSLSDQEIIDRLMLKNINLAKKDD